MTVVPQSEGLNPAYPAFCGRNAVFVGADPAGIDLLDFATGAVRRVAGPVGGFGVSDPTLSENWIVWISPRHESKADRGPLRWVISALPVTDVDANPVEVASGTSVEPPFPNEPLLAIDGIGDLLAYTVESPQPGHPQATAIVVHNLATGTDVTRIQTEESLWSLDLSGANVIYSEGIQDQEGFYPNTRVMLAIGGAKPIEIARYGYEVAIDGQRLVWAQGKANSFSPYQDNQTVVTATISNLQPVQLSRQATASQVYQGYWPAAGEGLVSWHDMPVGAPGDELEIWDPQTGATVPIFDPGSLTVSGICGGWIGWETSIEWPPGTLFDAFYETAVDAVRRLFQ